MSITIASIGLATAQGSAFEILSGAPLAPPQTVPWPLRSRTLCRICRPARGIARELEGPDRWGALARAALDECLRTSVLAREAPLVIASCNGSAHSSDQASWLNSYDACSLLIGTPWEGQGIPIVSGSCASGLHAFYLAAHLLTGDVREVVVLAVDILSAASHENFESLRILATHPTAPWQPTSEGFVPGEAAVAIRITRNGGSPGVQAGIPTLRQDLHEGDGLQDVVTAFRSCAPSAIVGQGTGPWAIDSVELDSVDVLPDRRTPITTPALHFGHTLGASGLLSSSLAALAREAGDLPPALRMPPGMHGMGRPLADRVPSLQHALVICRALSGACAGLEIGRAREQPPWPSSDYRPPSTQEPTAHSVLRKIAADAARVRPPTPPDILLVRLGVPLVPPASGLVGDRLLPHAVLEITPAAIPRIIARRWGYNGPALCLVGDDRTESVTETIVAACRAAGETVAQIRIGGTGSDRTVDWDVQSN